MKGTFFEQELDPPAAAGRALDQPRMNRANQGRVTLGRPVGPGVFRRSVALDR